MAVQYIYFSGTKDLKNKSYIYNTSITVGRYTEQIQINWNYTHERFFISVLTDGYKEMHKVVIPQIEKFIKLRDGYIGITNISSSITQSGNISNIFDFSRKLDLNSINEVYYFTILDIDSYDIIIKELYPYGIPTLI